MLPESVDAACDGKKYSHIDVRAQEKFRAAKKAGKRIWTTWFKA
jgi:hypothetical protein